VDRVEGPPDQDLVAAALRDPQAFADIVRRYEPVLRRYLRRLLGWGTDQTEDILQEAFLKAYVNLNDFDRSRPFSPWIYRIVRNEAISSLRKRRREPMPITGGDGALLLERLQDGSDPLSALEVAACEQALLLAVKALEPKYRDVIVLRYLEERSYDEISEILRLPMGTVATLIGRGKQRLKRALKQAGIDA
jgi:RNA polymerase sigma-70 factor, ECF subfamily